MSAHQAHPPGHYELRYLIDEETALRLRDFVGEYLELEEQCVGRPGYATNVESLYLDSPDLKLFWQTIARPERHQQLRLRSYRDAPGGPVTLEIKHFHADGVTKEQVELSPSGAKMLLDGELPGHDPLLEQQPNGLFTAEHFWALMQGLQAHPIIRVTYARESYVTCDRSSTVNFDRALAARLCPDRNVARSLADHWQMAKDQVICELKFTERFPKWFREMAETFNLIRTDVCKYRTALSALGANPEAGVR